MARRRSTTPRQPAPVSGPGALARRTDGGPGSARQPLRTPTGLEHGEAGALLEQQRQSPLAAAAAPPGPSPAAGIAQGLGPPPAFGPTQRPLESPLAGLNLLGQPSVTPDDPDALTRDLYALYPHPDIGRLLG